MRLRVLIYFFLIFGLIMFVLFFISGPVPHFYRKVFPFVLSLINVYCFVYYILGNKIFKLMFSVIEDPDLKTLCLIGVLRFFLLHSVFVIYYFLGLIEMQIFCHGVSFFYHWSFFHPGVAVYFVLNVVFFLSEHFNVESLKNTLFQPESGKAVVVISAFLLAIELQFK